MENKISPKYIMHLIFSIKEKLYEEFKSYDNVAEYLKKWQDIVVQDYNYIEYDFDIQYKGEPKKFDAIATLHCIDSEKLLKIAIDLGLETPDFIPCIPTFKNELKSSYNTASQTFEKAFFNVEKDPALAVGLANSAIESIVKEIAKDPRVNKIANIEKKDTTETLIKKICKAFKFDINSPISEIKSIAGGMQTVGQAIEKLRSDKSPLHGKTDEDYMIDDPLYAYFIVNSVSTIGLFLLNFYKKKYPKENEPVNTGLGGDDLPF